MNRILLERVAFAYAGSNPLIHELSLELTDGITALAGPNGSGKSTLLRLIPGELEATRGSLRCELSSLHLLRQAPGAPTRAVRALAERWDKEAFALRSRFELPGSGRALDGALPRRATTLAAGRGLERLGCLTLGRAEQSSRRSYAPSPGETRKLVLAVGLDANPEALVLDESENHLDAPAVDRLEQMIADYSGAVLVISHDRRLQEAIAPDRIIDLEDVTIRTL